MDKKGTTSYTNDLLNRLETVTEPSGKTTTYEFDGAGVAVARYGTKSWSDSKNGSTSYGVHIHYGGTKGNNDSPKGGSWAYSNGCLLIEPGSYNDFARVVGFDKDGEVNKGEKADKVSGYVVVDRIFMHLDDPNLNKIYGKEGLNKIK